MPPNGETVAVPFLPPLQLTLFWVVVAVNDVGWVMVIVFVAEH